MKEELISFETAKLAKEKGFDVKSYNFYRNNGILAGDLGVTSGVKLPVSSGINKLVAPTQSLLQKWLREEHKIFVTPTTEIYTLNHGYEIFIYGELDAEPEVIEYNSDTDKWDFKSYEEALEAGLKEALKLIK